jgi:hypothetical protein
MTIIECLIVGGMSVGLVVIGFMIGYDNAKFRYGGFKK